MRVRILFNDGVVTDVDDVSEWFIKDGWLMIKTDNSESHALRGEIIQEVASGHKHLYANEGPL